MFEEDYELVVYRPYSIAGESFRAVINYDHYNQDYDGNYLIRLYQLANGHES